MVDTLQVDELARISGLTPARYKTHPQPLKDIPPRRIKHVAVETLIILVDRDYELPANKTDLNKPKLHTGTLMHTYTETENTQMAQERERERERGREREREREREKERESERERERERER